MAKVILLFGSPKAGHSVFASCLRITGITSMDDNVPMDAHTINKLMLQDLCHTSLMSGRLPRNWMASDAAKTARQRIRQLTATCTNNGGTFFLADSLFSRTVRLWLETLRQQGADVVCVHIIRHPFEVALSLRNIGADDLVQSHLIWLSYVRDALSECAHQSHIQITFDQLLADPVNALLRIARAFGFTFPLEPSAVCQNLLDFVNPCLKQHHAGRANAEEQSRFLPFTRLYHDLRQLALDMGEANPSGMGQCDKNEVAKIAVPYNEDLLNAVFESLGQYERHLKRVFATPDSSTLSAHTGGGQLSAGLVLDGFDKNARAQWVALVPELWQRLVIDIQNSQEGTDLQFVPLNVNGAVSISAIRLLDKVGGVVHWSASLAANDPSLNIGGSLVCLPDPENLVLLVTGPNPYIKLRWPPGLPNGQLQLEVWLKPSRDQHLLQDNRVCAPALKRWRMLSMPRSSYKAPGVHVRPRPKIRPPYPISNPVPGDTQNRNQQTSVQADGRLIPEGPRPDRKQIIVLGMHRSGTSAITGALHAMGAHVGGEDQLTGKSWENPHGFFERRDARQICDALLQQSDADWWKISGFSPEAVTNTLVTEQGALICKLIEELDQHSAWALKEPRLCLLFAIWRRFLDDPVVVYVHRNPIEVARSLRHRNGFSMRAGLALWEAYNISALSASTAHDCIFVNYGALVNHPRQTIEDLLCGLRNFGLAGLSADQATEAVDHSLYRQQARGDDALNYLTEEQHLLWSALNSGWTADEDYRHFRKAPS
jgi:hypothetical protein